MESIVTDGGKYMYGFDIKSILFYFILISGNLCRKEKRYLRNVGRTFRYQRRVSATHP